VPCNAPVRCPNARSQDPAPHLPPEDCERAGTRVGTPAIQLREIGTIQAIPTPQAGAPGRIRTCDTRFRKPVLYPLSYGGAVSKCSERAGARTSRGS
jgi:hypothetical protein